MSIGVELRQYISQTHTKKFLNPANPPPSGYVSGARRCVENVTCGPGEK